MAIGEVQISTRQQKALEKITRLRKYFGRDNPKVFEWSPSDETVDFAGMTDEAVAAYLETGKA